MEEQQLRQRLLRLAREKPEVRKHLLPLLRGSGASKQSGRVWDSAKARSMGQTYGPPYTSTAFKQTPPTNRGPGKCYSDTRNESDRCYVKRNLGTSLSKRDYNRKYRQRVLK